MMDVSLNIRVADNGVILRYDDPKIVASNREDDADYKDPSKEMVFKSAKEAMPEAQRILKKLMGEESSDDDYESAFNEAATDE